MKRFLILFILIVFVTVSCAAHNPNFSYRIPLSRPPQIRADLGTIAIVSAKFTPEPNFPERTSTEETAAFGAAGGALEGASLGLLLPLTNPYAIFILPITVGVGAAIGAVVGGIAGALVAPSKGKTEMAEASIKNAIEEFKNKEAMRNLIIGKIREQTQYEPVLLEDRGPITLDEAVNYSDLTGKGIDTVLEISVRKYGFWSKGVINPPPSFLPLSFFMTVSTRLIGVKDGEVLHNKTFRYENEKGQRQFIDWGAKNAQLLREEFDLCSQYLTGKIVKEVFFLRESVKDNVRMASRAIRIEGICGYKSPFDKEGPVTDGVLMVTDQQVSFLAWDDENYETLLEFGYDKISNVEVKGYGRGKRMVIFENSGICFTFELLKEKPASITVKSIVNDPKETVEMVDFISKKLGTKID